MFCRFGDIASAVGFAVAAYSYSLVVLVGWWAGCVCGVSAWFGFGCVLCGWLALAFVLQLGWVLVLDVGFIFGWFLCSFGFDGVLMIVGVWYLMVICVGVG